MQIWLKCGSDRMRIPVLPSEYTVTSEQENTSITVCNLGEINLLGKQKLRSISFSSFFPRYYDGGYCDCHCGNPRKMVERIEKMKQAGKIKLTITDTGINMYVSIESFEWGENDGTGDINYTLSMKEYRHVSIPTSILMKETSAAPTADETAARDQPSQTATQSYTVKAGDCLSTIAKKLTGSANWKAIYEQNKSVIGSNPNMIKSGQVLTIPGAKT